MFRLDRKARHAGVVRGDALVRRYAIGVLIDHTMHAVDTADIPRMTATLAVDRVGWVIQNISWDSSPQVSRAYDICTRVVSNR